MAKEYIERDLIVKNPMLHTWKKADLLRAIKESPTADVEEVRHGEWLEQNLCGKTIYVCSNCQTLGSPLWKRCPICEVKMNGGKNEKL